MMANVPTVRLIASTDTTSSKLKPLAALRRFRKLLVSRMYGARKRFCAIPSDPHGSALNTQSCKLMLGTGVGNVKVPGYTGHPDNGL